MRMLLHLALPALLLFTLSCSNSTDPGGSDQDEFVTLTEISVGPEGGLLEADGFRLDIPAGAFATTRELVLAVGNGDHPFEDDGATALYRIEGLPDHRAAPLRVAIRYEGNLGGESFLADGAPRHSSELDEEVLEYFYREAADSMGYLVGEWPADPAPEGSREEGASAGYHFFTGLGGQFTLMTPAFTLMGSSHQEAGIRELAELLENQRSVIDTELQLDSDNWPIPGSIWVQVEPGDFGLGSPRVFIDPLSAGIGYHVTIKLGDSALRPGVGPELPGRTGPLLIHAYQYIQDSGPIASYFYDLPTHKIVHKAFESWFEKVFTTDEDYVHPGHFTGVEQNMLGGLFSGVTDDYSGLLACLRGYNLGPMIDYLMSDPGYEYGGFRYCYQDIAGGMHPMDALFAATTTPKDEWLPDFYAAYAMGEHYGVSLLDDLTLADIWEVNQPDSTFAVEGGENFVYSDLSAKIFGIDLDGASLGANAKIHFQVTSDEVNDELLSVVVLALRADSLFYVGEGEDWILEGVQTELVDQGVESLYAIVVNGSHALDYQGETEIYLSMELIEPPEAPSYQQLVLYLTVDAWINEFDHGDVHFPDYDFNYLVAQGPIDAPRFEVPIDLLVGSTHTVGSIRGVVSEDFSVVDSLFVEAVSSNATTTRVVSITLVGPIASTVEEPHLFQVWGHDVCPHLESVEMTFTNSAGTDELISATCNEHSEISIAFWGF